MKRQGEYTFNSSKEDDDFLGVIIREFRCLPDYVILRKGKKTFRKLLLPEDIRVEYLLSHGYKEIYDY